MDEQDSDASNSTIDGYVDGFDGWTLSGWACDRSDLGRCLQINIHVGDDVITVPASQERQDVVATGRATGPCGFEARLYLDILNPTPIHVREARTGSELIGSPLHLPSPRSNHNVSAVEGTIDFIDGNQIVGWAHDKACPGRRVRVEIVVGEGRTVIPADQFRQDVATAGVNDGWCGFTYSFDAQAAIGRLIRVQDAVTGVAFRGSPFRADIPSRLASPNHRETMAVLRTEALLAWDAIDRVFAVPDAGAVPRPGSKLERLLKPAFPDDDPGGLITRYVASEIARSGRRDLVPNGTLVERLQALHWYLTACNAYHHFPVPLSPQQLAFLNAPMPLLGSDAEISVAAHAFITAEFDPGLNLRDRAALHRALCWWCIQRAPEIAPGGELIALAEARTLTVTDPTGDFPLTPALRALCAGDHNLVKLNLRSDVDRAALAAAVVLRSLRLPHLAKLLPESLGRALLYPKMVDQYALLDVLLRLALGPAEPGVADRAGDLCRRVRTAYTASPARSYSYLGSGRPFLRDPRFADGLDPGVAVIGPMRATSGIGQAARLSFDILAHAGCAPAQFDFFPGNAAPVGYSDRPEAATLRVPRRINLLHLNAEFIPHAFALLDARLTQESYNIGYFFWELDTVPECHRLAFDLLDEIWVSSEYNREIYARATGLPVHNVGMTVNNPSDVPIIDRAGLGLAADAFVFLAALDSFSYFERKNPFGVLAAFQEAFPIEKGERVALLIKTQNRGRVVDPHQLALWQRIEEAAARDPRIVILHRTVGYQTMIGLKQACDAYVSLHRSEGFGFGCLEAMRLGLPVIATGYSGTAEFCRPDTAYLVDYDLVPVLPTDYVHVERGSQWAEPSRASAVAALRAVYEDPLLRRSLAAAGRRCATTEFCHEAIGQRYVARLTAIEASLGAR